MYSVLCIYFLHSKIQYGLQWINSHQNQIHSTILGKIFHIMCMHTVEGMYKSHVYIEEVCVKYLEWRWQVTWKCGQKVCEAQTFIFTILRAAVDLTPVPSI